MESDRFAAERGGQDKESLGLQGMVDADRLTGDFPVRPQQGQFIDHVEKTAILAEARFEPVKAQIERFVVGHGDRFADLQLMAGAAKTAHTAEHVGDHHQDESQVDHVFAALAPTGAKLKRPVDETAQRVDSQQEDQRHGNEHPPGAGEVGGGDLAQPVTEEHAVHGAENCHAGGNQQGSANGRQGGGGGEDDRQLQRAAKRPEGAKHRLTPRGGCFRAAARCQGR